jgi:membrane-bound lytic murein transglycosylase B
MLSAALLALPLADAAPHAGRTTSAKHVTGSDLAAREKLVIAHIKHRLGEYGSSIVDNPRFTIDPTILSVPRQKPKRADYDYVFSPWSKEQGQRFLQNNDFALGYVEKKFGVPREVVDAVLNIETQWGRNLGKRSVVTTLYTLAVMQPDRVAPGWPEKQLLVFLTIFKDSDVDLFSIKGSSTGAFGLSQFEPTSYLALAVSCKKNEDDDDDPPDLFDNNDAICSIGNYLSRAGWSTSEESHRHALFAYNQDNSYVAAILDYADWLAGKELAYPRYKFFDSRKREPAATK